MDVIGNLVYLSVFTDMIINKEAFSYSGDALFYCCSASPMDHLVIESNNYSNQCGGVSFLLINEMSISINLKFIRDLA